MHAFLERRLPFTRIVPLVAGALDALPPKPVAGYADITEADAAARAWVQEQIPDAVANR